MKLILTRHGETIENKEGIFQGQEPGRLSELGIRQAKKLAIRLKDEKIDCIYSSDLARAADTAREIAKYHPNVPVFFVKDLRERDIGELQGVRKSDIGLDKRKLYLTHIKIEDGESVEQLFNRAKRFLVKVFSEHKDDTVLFVGHNAINVALTAAILNKSSDYMKKIENQPAAAVSIFEIRKDKNNVILLMNCVKHLGQ